MILFSSDIYSTHIVGGVIYYEYLGGTNYKLTFKIYRDCTGTALFDGDTGINTAQFFFGVFEGNTDVLILDQNIRTTPLLSISPVNSAISNLCLTTNGSCVQEGLYEKIITLPANNVGYTIIYQRCCRNGSILNIEPLPGMPTMPGITLRCFIPPIATFQNNSAVFKKLPPIFICKDQAFYFDHSATDKDGDSLKYFLINPLAGLDNVNPSTSAQSLSDNIPIPWLAPYSSANILGGTLPLQIDSITGFLQCKPNTFGRFVVSVLVTETRGGIVIDSIVRDFQFNVVSCDIPKADMPFIERTYDPNTGYGDYLHTFCDTLLAQFVNTSSNANAYKWDFGDPVTGINNTSTLFQPIHLFSDTGIYIIKLFAYKLRSTDTCVDSTVRRVRVFPNFRINFSVNNGCQGDSIQFTDLTTSQYGKTTNWNWEFGDGQSDTSRYPKHKFNTSGTFNVKLTCIDNKFCKDNKTKSIVIYPKPIVTPTTNKLCFNETKELKANCTNLPMDSIAIWKWKLPGSDSFKAGISFTSSSFIPINLTLVSTTNHGCKDSAIQTLITYPLPTYPTVIDSYFIKCKDSISVSIKDSTVISYWWIDGSRDSIRMLNSPGFYKFRLNYPCIPNKYEDSFVVYTSGLKAKFIAQNVCEDSFLFFQNLTTFLIPSSFKWLWKFGDGLTDTSQFPAHIYNKPDLFIVKLIVKDTFNCIDSFSQKITTYAKPILNPVIPKLCIGVPTEIKCGASIPVPYQIAKYQWDTNGIVNAIGTCNFIYTAQNSNPISLNLRAISDKGCQAKGTYQMLVHTVPNPKVIIKSHDVLCNDSIYVDISDTMALSYFWSDSAMDSIRHLHYPGIIWYRINYPCLTYYDTLSIVKRCSVKVPSAFSPNGDGSNDILFIRGFGVKKLLSFDIFNRWGQLIFHTEDFYFGWDGHYKGVLQNSDMYFYTYTAETWESENLNGQGNFMLLK